MLDFFLIFFSIFLAGFSAKAADTLEKSKKLEKFSYLFSFVYGLILGILSSFSCLSNLFISLALANAVAYKLDSKPHLFGFLVFLIPILIFDLNCLDLWLFGLFFCFGFLDEFFENKKIKILNYRLLLPAVSLFILLYKKEPIYFFAILIFDIGYNLFIFLKQKFKYKL
ncbi:MAG: hypothetical protein ACK4J0_01575 [Candidatus Anstonellaceae archaeon]